MKFDEAKPKSTSDKPRMDDLIDIYKFPKKVFVSVRILNLDILPIRLHWIKLLAGKDKKEVTIPKFCIAFDPNTEENKEGVKCPYCALEGQRIDTKYHANAIIREAQDDKPRKAKEPNKAERKSGFKSAESESWTPVSVLRLPPTVTTKILELKEINKKKNKKTGKTEKYSISHPKFGCDIAIKFDPDAKGGDMYQVQMQDRTPLTEEEQGYLVYNLHEGLLDEAGRESMKEAKEQLARMNIVGAEEIEEDDDDDGSSSKKKKKKGKDDDDDDDELSVSSKKKGKDKKKSKKDDDDDEDDDDDDSDSDDDEDDEPKGKKKGKKSKSDDDDDDDDDEPKSKKKSKKSKDDDDEDDEDSDEDDDDDDESDDDEDSDEDDDEDDDDEDEKPVKGKKGKEKDKKKKSKKDDDDDDDDDDDSDDDEDDDEPKSKKSKKKSKSDDDDDDDDEDEKPKKGKKGKKKPIEDDDIPF